MSVMRHDVADAAVSRFMADVRRQLCVLYQDGVDEDGLIAAARVVRSTCLLEFEELRRAIESGELEPELPKSRDLEGPELIVEFFKQLLDATRNDQGELN